MMMSSPTTVSEALLEWYTSVSSEVSLGDIVRLVPYGLIDAPMTICKPANSELNGKAKYYEFAKSPKGGIEFLHARFTLSVGIVVWPDCQIDKAKNQKKPRDKWFAAIAPVIPTTKLESKLYENVRTFNRAQYFPLPPKGDLIPESYVDLRYVWPMRYSLLEDRILTLTQQAKNAFILHRFWFDTEVRFSAQVECPHCHNSVDAASFFVSKNPEQ
jgi:hypothetical protein